VKLRAFANGMLVTPWGTVRCALGKGGVVPADVKREGDGASPAGLWPIRRVLYRPDRGAAPVAAFPVAAIAPDDGWCDAAHDPAYNRPVRLPYPASAERMWREDHVYDIVVVLAHNDDPVVAGAGSAIFFHLAKPGFAPTEGCIAVTRPDMETILARAPVGTAMEILPV